MDNFVFVLHGFLSFSNVTFAFFIGVFFFDFALVLLSCFIPPVGDTNAFYGLKFTLKQKLFESVTEKLFFTDETVLG